MIKKGEVWLVDFNPTIGSEQSGIRPALVISGNMMNSKFPLSMVCPLTSVPKKFSGNVNITASEQNGLKTDSQVLVFHIKTISHKRFMKRIGVVEEKYLELITLNLNKLLRY
jgi:mRNA interferase MazF